LVRRYGREAVERLQFIKRAQRFGFSLDEVKAREEHLFIPAVLDR
jgi:DNA-binding transcriptional MerR regulator